MTLARIIVPLLVFLACLVAWAPMRSALGVLDMSASGVSVGHASGTIWRGSLMDVTWRGARLGDFQTRARLSDILTGTPGFSFRSNGPLVSGEVVQTGSGWRLDRLSGRVDLATLSPQSPAGILASFTGVSLEATQAGCRVSAGRVMLEGAALGDLSGIQGELACVDGRTVVDLVNPASGGKLRAWLATGTDGVTRAQAQTEDPVLLAAMLSAGIPLFAPDAS